MYVVHLINNYGNHELWSVYQEDVWTVHCNVVELAEGGSVINGATPSNFHESWRRTKDVRNKINPIAQETRQGSPVDCRPFPTELYH